MPSNTTYQIENIASHLEHFIHSKACDNCIKFKSIATLKESLFDFCLEINQCLSGLTWSSVCVISRPILGDSRDTVTPDIVNTDGGGRTTSNTQIELCSFSKRSCRWGKKKIIHIAAGNSWFHVIILLVSTTNTSVLECL